MYQHQSAELLPVTQCVYISNYHTGFKLKSYAPFAVNQQAACNNTPQKKPTKKQPKTKKTNQPTKTNTKNKQTQTSQLRWETGQDGSGNIKVLYPCRLSEQERIISRPTDKTAAWKVPTWSDWCDLDQMTQFISNSGLGVWRGWVNRS